MDARVEAERETADEGWPGRRRGGGGEGQEGREEEKLREPKLQEPSALLQVGWGQKHPPQNFKDASICHLHVIVYTFTSLLAPLGALIAIRIKYFSDHISPQEKHNNINN